MHQVLVYADSLSWGIVPGTRNRLDFPDRWPGLMEHELQRRGINVRVIEDCLNGRRTVWEDPLKPGRNALAGLEQRIEVNSPLSLVIIMLGTNDFQAMHQNTAEDSAKGVQMLVQAIRCAPIEPGMNLPEVMLVAPPAIQSAKGDIAPKFLHAEVKSQGLNHAIRDVAIEMNCPFFDAGSVTQTSTVDGVHLDTDQHRTLGLALAESVQHLLN